MIVNRNDITPSQILITKLEISMMIQSDLYIQSSGLIYTASKVQYLPVSVTTTRIMQSVSQTDGVLCLDVCDMNKGKGKR